MQYSSRTVHSSQTGPNLRLSELLQRHHANADLTPVAEHTRAAFDRLANIVTKQSNPIVLDSGCGTGQSSEMLARQFADCWVIGVDRSEHRLSRLGCDQGLLRRDNLILIRAELAGFWRLAVEAGWRLDRHYIFYPNPWPKPGHLQRRWHGHAAFPTLLRLGGLLELRSNWATYIDEFAMALGQSGCGEAKVANIDASDLSDEQYVSPFEKKYARSGHVLTRLTIDLRKQHAQ